MRGSLWAVPGKSGGPVKTKFVVDKCGGVVAAWDAANEASDWNGDIAMEDDTKE